MFSEDIEKLATKTLEACRARGWTLSTAESCTGGLIAGALTEIAGSSDVVDRGFVTYSNQAKSDLLDVDMKLIDTHGAVSAEVAEAMASGALAKTGSGIAIAVTGVAGPGASENKPAGLVYIGVATTDMAKPLVTKNQFSGDRTDVRSGTVKTALFMALSACQHKSD